MIQAIRLVGILAIVFGTAGSAYPKSANRSWRLQSGNWTEIQKSTAWSRMKANISRADAAPGSVVASPSRSNPDYYYHWVRDAALTMDVCVSAYRRTTSVQEKNQLLRAITDYVQFSLRNQTTNTLTSLGEPKFHVDGSPFNGPWGRPQNDGPALRAITAAHFAFALLREGREDYVRSVLYDSAFPSKSLIKNDLEYVAQHWHEPSFDLWEEVKGDHFYTRMVQRRALIEGAQLARVLGDSGAADFYLAKAQAISKSLIHFWSSNLKTIVPTLNWVEGVDYKTSGSDVAVLLGVLHGNAGDGFLPASSPYVLATAQRLIGYFINLYSVNQRAGIPGVAVGRYPEDRYSGSGFGGGNPWILATAAVGEIYYRASFEVREKDPQMAKRYWDLGEQFLERIHFHANPDGSMSEQWDRYSGYMTSARDLTWSYASFLTLMDARESAQ